MKFIAQPSMRPSTALPYLCDAPNSPPVWGVYSKFNLG